MKRTLAFSLIVGLILATPAIAGATAKPPTTARLRSEFLSAVKPLNAAETTSDRSVNALPSSAPFSALEPIDSPFSNALLTAAGKLSRLGATGKIATDIKALDAAYTCGADTWKLPSCRAPIRAEHGCVTSQPRRRRKSPSTTRCARRSAYRCHRATCRERRQPVFRRGGQHWRCVRLGTCTRDTRGLRVGSRPAGGRSCQTAGRSRRRAC